MDFKERFKETYKEKYLKFIFEVKENPELMRLELDKIPSLHIPGFGRDYQYAKRKVLYLGIDTVDWESLSFINTENDLPKKVEDLIFYSSDSLRANEMIEWWKKDGRTSPFWNIIFKIHLGLKDINSEITLENSNFYFQDFAWGNTHSLQTYEHALKHCPNLQRDQYRLLQELSKPIDSLETMISILSPDIIIILNGSTWDNVNFQEYFKAFTQTKEDEKCSIYEYITNENKCKIFWFSHPRSSTFGNHTEAVNYIKNEILG